MAGGVTEFRPHPYQARAIEWIVDHPACGLLLDMGLGKTVVTLTALQRLQDWCEIDRTLVVAPKTVAESTWGAEAAKWRHLAGMRVSVVAGDAGKRLRALERDADVYVVGVDNFVWLAELYRARMPFDCLVLDELTRFKNHRSLRWKAVKRTRRCYRRVIGLTGTPAPNGLFDLWAQVYCLDGGERLGTSVTRWRDAYFDYYEHNHMILNLRPKAGAREAIEHKIGDICLSMQARDYLELPPLIVHDVRVELPPGAMEGYRRFERDMVLAFFAREGKEADGSVAASSAGVLLGKLAQYANGAVYDDAGTAQPVHAAKLDMLEEIVEQAQSPVLVFYQYKHDVERIAARLAKKRLRVRRYEKAADLEAWNAGDVDVLLAHPASTAYGLNMQQGGHYIVWFGLGWNLELYQQANARLHRQGQRRPVQVYRLLAAGTVDERVAEALTGKRAVQDALLEGLRADMDGE